MSWAIRRLSKSIPAMPASWALKMATVCACVRGVAALRQARVCQTKQRPDMRGCRFTMKMATVTGLQTELWTIMLACLNIKCVQSMFRAHLVRRRMLATRLHPFPRHKNCSLNTLKKCRFSAKITLKKCMFLPNATLKKCHFRMS